MFGYKIIRTDTLEQLKRLEKDNLEYRDVNKGLAQSLCKQLTEIDILRRIVRAKKIIHAPGSCNNCPIEMTDCKKVEILHKYYCIMTSKKQSKTKKQ